MSSYVNFLKADIFYKMSGALHESMQEDTSLQTAWKGLRSEVIPKVFGDGFKGITAVEEAGFYVPLSVFGGESTSDVRPSVPFCGGNHPPKRFLGNLKDMIRDDICNPDLISRAISAEEDHRFPPVPRCHFHLIGIRHDTRKEIVLQLCGLRKYCTFLPILEKGDICLRPRYTDQKLSIIDEVFVVDQLWITTFGTYSTEDKKWESSGPIPVAFKLKEYSPDFFQKD